MSGWTKLALVSLVGVALAFGLGWALPDLESRPEKRVPEIEASWPDWLPKAEPCPADLMPPPTADPRKFSLYRCSKAYDQCRKSCRSGTAGDCYAAALVTQRVKDGPLAQALFQRSCVLGVASGCTNRAADSERHEGNACAIRTYELACDRDDPWA